MEKLIDRIVTIIFILALIAIVYFVGRYVSEKMLGKGETNDMEIAVDPDDFFSDEEDLEENYDSEDSDYYTEDDVEGKDVPEEYNDEIASIMEDVVEEDEKEIEEVVPAAVTTNTKTKASTETSVSNSNTSTATNTVKTIETRYLVVAGSFTSEANAVIQAKILEKEGYSPEIVNFNNSKMHTVLAARYNSRASAYAASKQLKEKKIECYVHTKRSK